MYANHHSYNLSVPSYKPTERTGLLTCQSPCLAQLPVLMSDSTSVQSVHPVHHIQSSRSRTRSNAEDCWMPLRRHTGLQISADSLRRSIFKPSWEQIKQKRSLDWGWFDARHWHGHVWMIPVNLTYQVRHIEQHIPMPSKEPSCFGRWHGVCCNSCFDSFKQTKSCSMKQYNSCSK